MNNHPVPLLSSSAPLTASTEAEGLATRLAKEMAERWRKGEHPLAEEFLSQYPELWQQPKAAVHLIYEEICLRQEAGQDLAEAEVLARFPMWQEQLAVVLGCQRLLQPDRTPPRFPVVGEVLGDFRLVSELGRGALGRVFLAVQPSLADRLVVLKLTPCDGQEHLSLARLQHTHIMPLYAVQDYPTRNLRLLCMPYFGGISLARLLEILKDTPPAQRTGQQLLSALAQTQAEERVLLPVKGPTRQFLEQASWAQVVCWIGACLADALHYAHERGLVHLDLKPSNVLLAADGQPLLLDFHLAREPLQPGSPAPERLGGTVAYMSPEQLAAADAVGANQPITVTVDGRSDVYSLGLLLSGTLGGTVPAVAEEMALLPRNPQVSVGLSDILAKCLAANAHDRYATAASLAADLRRHLEDRPLQGVPNRNLAERWRKWRQRRPHALALGSMRLVLLAALLTAGITLIFQVRQSVRETQQRLHQAEAASTETADHLKKNEYGEALSAARRGLFLVTSMPESGNLEQTLRNQFRLAQRGQAAQELHGFVDRVRFLYGMETLSPDTARPLADRCRRAWQQRRELLGGSAGASPSQGEQRLKTDLLDLGVIWADLQVRLASSAEKDGARQEALGVLAEVESLFGPSPILYRQRQALAEALGQKEAAQTAAAELKPQTAWEHYALGRFSFRSGDFQVAASEFERAIDLQPRDFWPHFYAGLCAYRLQRYEMAVNAFDVCVALVEQAECWYNRGLANVALDRTTRALADFDRALQLNPNLAAAALNRGILHYQARRYRQALDDLQRALDSGADPATVHYNLALVYRTQQDQGAALIHLRQALRHNPEHKQARELLDRLQREQGRRQGVR